MSNTLDIFVRACYLEDVKSVLHFARRYGNDRWFDHDLFFCIDHSISAKTAFKTGYSDSGNDENRKKDLSDSIDSKCTCCTLCWNSSNGCIWDYLAFEGIIGILEM